MRVAILSPHRDDAAFSCGLSIVAFLRAGAEITVLNVFTQSDYAVSLDTVNPSLPRVDAVSRARYVEDEQFLADAAAIADREPERIGLHDLNLLDAPLRLAVQTEQVLDSPLTTLQVQQQAEQVAGMLSMSSFDFVFAPLALGDHIDHRIVREAARLSMPVDRLCLYEDLPYAARLSSTQRKEQTESAIRSNRALEFGCHALHLLDGMHLKLRFANHYPSQIAPEVAQEMAQYAAQGRTGSAGAELWWAGPSTGARIADLLRGVADVTTC